MTFLRCCLVVLMAAAMSAQTAPSDDRLLAAIRAGSPAEVDRLLKGGASANAVGADGATALMMATLVGGSDMVGLLLERGADPNRTGPGGTTALMWAVPNLESVRRLVEGGANVNARSETERTALLVAASYPRTVPLLQLLLERGADLRAQDRAGATALSLAVRSADIDVVRFLVSRGLSPDGLSPGARRAGIARYDLPTVEYLIANAPTPTQDLLGTAATWHPAPMVARWIDLGADINASQTAQYGRTPLMNAVTSEAEGADTVRLLLERGADPNARMTEGETSLDWAIYKGDRAKIAVLEQFGAMRGSGPRREEIPPPARAAPADPRTALRSGVAQLMVSAPTFRDQATCISCHHNAMPALAAAAARTKGIDVDAAPVRKNIDDILSFFRSAVPRMMLGDPAVGGESLTTGYAQMALAAEGHPLDTVTAAMTHWLMARQMPDGRWLGNGLNRPPSEYSPISHTAIAAGGLTRYPLPGRSREVEASLRLAAQWLRTARPTSAEERGMRLMGLVWTGAPRSDVDAAVTDLRVQQDSAGGWSQFGRTAPDAYATGLSLYALHVAGVPATDEAYRRGVSYLLASQYPDGAWLVRTHAFPVQRYFESGFPFGRHQWISSAGTSWAVLAIAQALPDR